MLNYVRVPFIFLFLASCFGVFLRWQFITPTPGVNYTFVLHAHSHIMFLGWVFNALFLGLTIHHVQTNNQQIFRNIFIALQLLVVAMMISFPLEGYGFYSILFSTLHTFIAIYYAILFYRKTRSLTHVSVWFAHIALFFFVLSTAGPFSLGYLMSIGLGQSNWYYFSIYYYLHFQYNGLFLFGIFSLFFHLYESKNIRFDLKEAKHIGTWMALACVPAYFLSILWAKPGMIFIFLSGVAALIQVYAFIRLLVFLRKNRTSFQHFHTTSKAILIVVIFCFGLKLLLQLLSAHPYFAQMAYQLRPVVIAYLHLVLIGIITLFIIVWYQELNYLKLRQRSKLISFMLFNFIGIELCLVLTPWWRKIAPFVMWSAAQYLLVFSVLLSLSFLVLLSAFKKPDKNQP